MLCKFTGNMDDKGRELGVQEHIETGSSGEASASEQQALSHVHEG
jgi:hypothetical protein